MENRKTQHLVALAQEGDAAALSQLCSVYGERVRRIVRLRLDRKLRPKLDSVDVVQDALLLALGGLKDFTYRNEGDFLRWLSTIAENRLRDILDGFHADKRDIDREIPFKTKGSRTDAGSAGAAEPMRDTTPSVVLVKKEALDRLEKALDQLKPEKKEIIAEIAQRLGKNTGAVRMLLARAMAALTLAYGQD
jgi:RNA polymerase sigma-70 factor (ECF subfamily)